jgi:hypothetical protein
MFYFRHTSFFLRFFCKKNKKYIFFLNICHIYVFFYNFNLFFVCVCVFLTIFVYESETTMIRGGGEIVAGQDAHICA